MASTEASPASVLTSIGKNVTTTITAALDCQSNPNHITMIGAMPTIGMALTRLHNGSSPRLRNGTRSDQHRHQESRGRAQGEAGQHRLEEGLPEIRPQDVHPREQHLPHLRRRGQQDLRHARSPRPGPARDRAAPARTAPAPAGRSNLARPGATVRSAAARATPSIPPRTARVRVPSIPKGPAPSSRMSGAAAPKQAIAAGREPVLHPPRPMPQQQRRGKQRRPARVTSHPDARSILPPRRRRAGPRS